MALVLADRVKETTTTTGTGTVTLLGAVAGFQSFAAVGGGNTTYYTIAGRTTSEWEAGIGTYTASGTTLARTTVLASSNAGSLVSFSAGTKDVFVTYPAKKSVNLDDSNNLVVLPVVATVNTFSDPTDFAFCFPNFQEFDFYDPFSPAFQTAVLALVAGDTISSGGIPYTVTGVYSYGSPIVVYVTDFSPVYSGSVVISSITYPNTAVINGATTVQGGLTANGPTTTTGMVVGGAANTLSAGYTASVKGLNVENNGSTGQSIVAASAINVDWGAAYGGSYSLLIGGGGIYGADVRLEQNTGRLPGIGGMVLSTTGSTFTNSPILFDVQGTERMRVSGAAPILVLAGGSTTATGTGIAFPATQSASTDANTLDDYEEGTWTPGVAYGGGSTGQVYSNQTGSYIKIGRLVSINASFNITNNGSSTGNATISGLPFPIATFGTGTFMGDGFTGTFAQIGLLHVPGTCYIATQIGGTGSLGGWGNTNQTNFSSGAKYITLTYMTS